MKNSPVLDAPVEKKGHVCPSSNATHPRDRWESFFVYAFICKFTQLRGKVEGLETAMDFEDAVLAPEADPVMTQILARFVLNLRPQTRNLSSDVISSTVAAVLQEFLKTNERTVFWDDDLKTNLDPFQGQEGGFWAASWDFKLKILRQLVELQLCHSPEIKRIIDRAWGVVHNKHKKHEMTPAPPPPSDPNSQQNLQLAPLGQDRERKRYWVVDDSPRVYLSTNPWKITATFQCLCSTRDGYVELLDSLKQNAPSELKAGERKSKVEQGHLNLLKVLEDRLPAIDAELARIQRARKKIAQRALLIAQAEVRETRTRRRTTRPDYAYLNDPAEDDQDEYKYQDEEDEEFNYEDDEFGQENGPHRRSREGTRRSTRSTRATSNGQQTLDEWSRWRGERRSTRLGAPAETQLDGPPPKRARTADSTGSSMDEQISPVTVSSKNDLKLKVSGAAAIKPTETVVEAVAGKKRSRFWVYAVEPIGPPQPQETTPLPPSSDYEMSESSVEPLTVDKPIDDVAMEDEERSSSTEYGTSGESYRRSIARSPSPSSMDES